MNKQIRIIPKGSLLPLLRYELPGINYIDKGGKMIQLLIERLDRIEKKIDGKQRNRFLDLTQVSKLTSLSASTIRRAVRKGELKCSRKLGKLLFEEKNVRRWING